MTREELTEALELIKCWKQGCVPSDYTYAISDTTDALRKALAQPEQNLSCKSTQARLAASWGYVKAQPEQPSEYTLDTDAVGPSCTPADWRGQKQEPMHPEIKKMYEDFFDKCFRESST